MCLRSMLAKAESVAAFNIDKYKPSTCTYYKIFLLF